MKMTDRQWDVLIIGGASGVGKTSISRQLSQHYDVDLVRVDDFQLLLEATTTPEALPAIHYWNTHPNWKAEGIQNAVNRLIDVGRVLIPGLIAVINDHIEENLPMILEGDFILPEFAANFSNPKVKSIFIHEPEREQILQNYLAREGKLQQQRADISHSYGNWLAENCTKYGVAVIEARPWDTLVERII